MSYKEEVRERDKVCQECGFAGSRNNRLQVHHIIFKCRGGQSTPSNCILLCNTCHQAIHKADPYTGSSRRKHKKRRRR